MKCNTQLLFEHIFAFIVCRLRHYYQRMRIIILFALCRYAHSCAFISVIELPRIPAYCPKGTHVIGSGKIILHPKKIQSISDLFLGFFHAKKGRAFVAPALPFTFCRSRQKFLCIHLHRNNESNIRRMLDPPQRVK